MYGWIWFNLGIKWS